MNEIAVKDLIPYLKTAIELEASVYTQEEALKKAKWELERSTPEKKKVIMPKPKTIERPIRQQVPDADIGCGSIIFGALLGPVPLLGGIFGWISLDLGWFWSLLLILIGGGFTIAFLKAPHNNKKLQEKYNAEYKKELAYYELECEKNTKDYELELQNYHLALKKAEDEYKQELSSYHKAESVITQMERSLKEAKRTLDELYSVNWIFPKYHYMVAVCAFYEYFVTGRCSELAGPHGAYNLYEQELRLNIIIGQLDTIISKLESIRHTQHTLYTELNKANNTIQGVSNDVKKILSNTIEISGATQITALQQESTAKNTEALKYLSLANAANNLNR